MYLCIRFCCEPVQQLLADILAERDSVEDLNDVCEVLMEHSACTRVRDQTVETQANYTKLLTSVQGKNIGESMFNCSFVSSSFPSHCVYVYYS